ncbi:MAG: CDP-diacylglycerol--glycerol-3-phosphate 3-phosphatidyltransferase [Bacteroidota bacterium]
MKHLPNVLTIGRIVIVPVFLVLLFSGTLVSQLVATVLFIVAAISDYWDGRLAREYGVGSRLGQFLDPLADKVLVLGAFFAFLFLPADADGNRLAAGWWWWAVGLIALRDVAVTALRAWAERQGRSIQTRYAAKLKTTVQLTFLIAALVFLTASKLTQFGGWIGDLGAYAALALYSPATSVLLLVTVVLTLWTGALYFTRQQPTPTL